MYCPNCSATLSRESMRCDGCGADFGSESAWHPLSQEPASRHSPPSLLLQAPKPRHALQSVAVFALTGPFTGLLAIALQSGSKGSVSDVFHPFALLLAAAIGGPPAIVAGVVYGLLALAIVSVFPRVRVKALLGSLLGVSVGAAVASVYFAYFLSGNENITAKLTESVHLGALAGLLSGLISGWLFPVSREPIANPTSIK